MRLLALTCTLCVLVGCGSSHGSSPADASAGLGGQQNAGGKSAGGGELGGSSTVEGGATAEAGTAQGGATQGGSSSMAGRGGSSPGGAEAGGGPSVSSGGMGMLSGVCAGDFEQSLPQILSGQLPPSNLSVTGDELELFFNLDKVISVYQRTSIGVLFPDPTPVTELGDVCGALTVGGLDVTLDGLRLYIACSTDVGNDVGPLRLATRPDRQSPFVVAPEPLGTVGNSISISKDELTLYAVTTRGAAGNALVYQRASLNDSFGAGTLVEGLGGPFSFPEISPDGLNLFGVAGPGNGRLVVASRGAPSGSFSVPTSVGLPAPDGTSRQSGPTVSDMCQLYYLNFTGSSIDNTINLLPH